MQEEPTFILLPNFIVDYCLCELEEEESQVFDVSTTKIDWILEDLGWNYTKM